MIKLFGEIKLKLRESFKREEAIPKWQSDWRLGEATSDKFASVLNNK